MRKLINLKVIAIFFIIMIGLLTPGYSFLFFNKNANPVGEVSKVVRAVDAKQLACMAKNIFFEANGEPIAGQAAVARVVLNRVQHGFANNPCNVIYQTTYVEKQSEEGETYKAKVCQFSWVCEGKSEPNKNNPDYLRAKTIAYQVLAYDAYKDVVPKTTLFFHNTSVFPNWPYAKTKQIGNHVFYSKHKKTSQQKI